MRIWDQNDRILMKNFNPLSLIQNLNVTAKHIKCDTACIVMIKTKQACMYI